MTREILEEKSLMDLREIAKAQGVKSITKYRKSSLSTLLWQAALLSASHSTDTAEPQKPELEPEQMAPAAPYAPPHQEIYEDPMSARFADGTHYAPSAAKAISAAAGLHPGLFA